MPRTRILIGLLAAAGALTFQALTVHYNYGGDWTGLFCVGDRVAQPPELSRPYQFKNSSGYDAQGYRLIAHDPLLQRGFARYLDDPRYRYARILVPALAYVLGLGNDRYIDGAYIALMLAFIFAGAYWLAMWAEENGWPPHAGLLFLLVPATLVGIDRMTIDLALAALCIAYAVLRPYSIGWLLVLAAAALCRETGFLLIAAAIVIAARHKQWRAVIVTGSTALPALLWIVWITARTSSDPVVRTSLIPFSGFITRLWHPFAYSFTGPLAVATQILDYTALAGVAIALVCLWRLRRDWLRWPELLACAIPVLFVSFPDVWSEVYAFGRTMTPFWLFIALRGMQSRMWIALLPIVLMDTRIGWQMGSELLGIVKGLVT